MPESEEYSEILKFIAKLKASDGELNLQAAVIIEGLLSVVMFYEGTMDFLKEVIDESREVKGDSADNE